MDVGVEALLYRGGFVYSLFRVLEFDAAVMDTIKSFKGYGKVDAAEDREFRRKTIKRLILIGVASILLILIIVGVVVGVVANKHGNSSDTDGSPHTASPCSSIKAICSVTQYPESCFSSISSLKGANATNDPEELFKLALHVAIDAISKVSTAPDHFLSNDTRITKVLEDCRELLDNSVSQLTESLEALQPADGGGKALTEGKVDDLLSWISAAVTNQETRLDGFEGTAEGLKEKMEAAMLNSTRFTSNGLAILKLSCTSSSRKRSSINGVLCSLKTLLIKNHRITSSRHKCRRCCFVPEQNLLKERLRDR